MTSKSSSLAFLLIGALLGLSLLQLAPALAQKEKKEVQKWEYKYGIYRAPTIATELEAAGNEGWELISQQGDANVRTFFFKRPK